jgi:hypothetical protein
MLLTLPPPHLGIIIVIIVGGVQVLGEPGSSARLVTGYGLDGRGSISDGGRGFFLYPLRPGRLWGSPTFLYNGYLGTFRV